MDRFFLRLGKLAIVFFVLGGCSLAPQLTGKPEWLAQLEKRYGELGPGEIIDLDGERSMGFEELLDRLDGKKIIYVGESHNDMDHHDVQLEILQGLYARDPSLVIGMEMFERNYQRVLDLWSTGAIDRKSFVRESEWFSRWKFDFSYYEKILTFARENNIRILALNAPRELVEKVGDFGIKALSPGEKAMIAPIDTSDVHHRRYIQKVFKAHSKTSSKTFENFYEAQCVWDDTMAETISDFVTTYKGGDKKVIVFCGAGHIVYKFGIPMRAFRRNGLPYTTILPSSLQRTRGEFHEDEKQTSLILADYVWVTAGSTHERVRLGILAEESFAHEEGVVVRKVIKGSSAEKAGIQPGDTILSIDQETIDDMVDLRIALSEKESGSISRVVYRRDDKRRETEVTFLKASFH